MTEREWQLSRELAQTRMALCQAQSQLLAKAHEEAQAELARLGDKWEPPTPPDIAP